MSRDCPADMQERHEQDIQRLYRMSIPTWLRAGLIAGIGALVLGYFEFRSAVAAGYVTRQELRDSRDELRQEIRDMSRKIDALLERSARTAQAMKPTPDGAF